MASQRGTVAASRYFPRSRWANSRFAASAIPFEELAGGRLLDVGCNHGYNSIHAAVKYRFSTIGIDIQPRHIEASRFLADLAGASSEFELANAETFSRPRGFDVVLHFGTADNAIGYAMHSSRSHDAVIRVYDAAGSVIESREQTKTPNESAR